MLVQKDEHSACVGVCVCMRVLVHANVSVCVCVCVCVCMWTCSHQLRKRLFLSGLLRVLVLSLQPRKVLLRPHLFDAQCIGNTSTSCSIEFHPYIVFTDR